ncbi:membrane-associated transporter protein-like isoform X2 [Arctopsyche grandis]|uniref:membrane-associated transporter protein-like isoform X2 n=1 Tax=Arctopsyche grandis TaxID=121162 RepID=UPI00406D6FAE
MTNPKSEVLTNTYPHIYRRKTTGEMLRLSTAILGIEFAYSAETAFVAPILLLLGLDHTKMTIVWAISPILAFFISPLLGTLSDRSRLSCGRRRPFILFLSIGLVAGLIFVPFGADVGVLLGDNASQFKGSNSSIFNSTEEAIVGDANTSPIIGVIITILGTILLDFNADVSQSPTRTYMMEVCTPDDHARGLSTLTMMAGIGGFLGFALGGIDWNDIEIGNWIGGNIKFLFLMATIILIISVTVTVTSFKEIPLDLMEKANKKADEENKNFINNDELLESPVVDIAETVTSQNSDKFNMKEYIKSIVFLSRPMKILYLTNVLAWISFLSYALYFTDFVGECVYGGNPMGLQGSEELNAYNDGVRFGCWGLAMYALACSIYSLIIEILIKKFKAKCVFIGGLLVYSIGMVALVLLKSKISVLILSATAGIAFTTLFNIPYLIIGCYHTNEVKLR